MHLSIWFPYFDPLQCIDPNGLFPFHKGHNQTGKDSEKGRKDNQRYHVADMKGAI